MFQRTLLMTPARVSGVYTARTLTPTFRYLHTSPIVCKTTTEKVAEVADKVNKSVGRGLASAIETGEQVTEKTKETLGTTKEKAMGDAKSAAEKTNEAARATTDKMASEGKKARESIDEKL